MALLTNVKDISPEQIAEQYKERADIERGFRDMKSECQIGSARHWLPPKIRAYAAICFLALLLGRIMRTDLRKNGSIQSPTDAIRILKCLNRVEVSVNGEKRTGLTKCSEQQLSLLASRWCPSQHCLQNKGKPLLAAIYCDTI